MDRPTPPGPPRSLVEHLLSPVQRFLRTEAAAGVVLAAAALAALAWVNFGDEASYLALTERVVVRAPLVVIVNDGLMTLFFLVVGLEIKHELAHGHLNTVRKALLPMFAAAGGMLVPAIVYVAFNPSGPALAGWAIPMATDIAFAAGVLTLMKTRISSSVPVFLIALAIFDDIGGVLVIAAFYGDGIHVVALAGAAVAALLGALLVRRNPHAALVAIVGVALWLLFHEAGIHATLAGIALGLMVPATPVRDEPSTQRLVRLLHPWVAFIVVPLFAFLNAGVRISGVVTIVGPVFYGVLVGLVIGKLVGVFAATVIAVRAGVSTMPEGMDRRALLGISALAGIGFTVAIFIANLAFADAPALLVQAKVGILCGSLVATILGACVIATRSRVTSS